MPKLKTRSAAKKRFTFTGSGKLKRNFAFKRHNLRKRSQSMKRKARGTTILKKSDFQTIRNYLPYNNKYNKMARVKRGVQARAKHKKIIKQAKGYRGRSKNVFRIAIEKVEKGLQYAYRDRRTKKRNFRGLWIQRINAGVREHGMSYNQFINGVKKSEINIDRKILADIAKNNPNTFKFIVDKIRQTK